MLPRTLLYQSTRIEGDRVIPRYLTERDDPWLRALLEEYERFEGRKRSELAARLRSPLSVPAPRAKLLVVARVLEYLVKDRAVSAMPPQKVRWRVFRAAAQGGGSREEILQKVADETQLAAAELEAALFADLRGERRVPALPAALSPSVLASRANFEIASSLLRRSATLRITAFGNAWSVVHHARRLGLICTAEETTRAARRKAANDWGFGLVPSTDDGGAGVVLDVSGPLALFHHTDVYGRALASLLPRLGACEDFELVAECALGRGKHLFTLELCSGDPIVVGDELAKVHERIEERFVRDFRRTSPLWDVMREPGPLDVGGERTFPEFEIVHRHDPRRRFYLEIVRFWTREHVKEKLARWRASALQGILCVDARRQCRDGELPEDERVIRYESSIDPRAVLAVIDRCAGHDGQAE